MTNAEAFECCIPLLRALSARFYSCSYSVSKEDLYQAGCVGVLLAASRYREEHGAKFSTYALPWILGEMKRILRQNGMNAQASREWGLIHRTQDEFHARTGKEPTLEQLAAACDLAKERVIMLLETHRKPLSIEQVPENGAKTTNLESGSTALGREEKMDLLRALEGLPAREKQVILLRYFRDYTQKETARLLGSSQSSISKAENRALDCLRLAMKD